MINLYDIVQCGTGRCKIQPKFPHDKTVAVLAGNLQQFKDYMKLMASCGRVGEYIYIQSERDVEGIHFTDLQCIGTYINNPDHLDLIALVRQRLI